MSQNVYQFIDVNRVDPAKNRCTSAKLSLSKFTSPLLSNKPLRRPIAASIVVTLTVNGSAQYTTTFRSG